MVVERFPVCRDGDTGAVEGRKFYAATEDWCIGDIGLGGFSPEVCTGSGDDFEVK